MMNRALILLAVWAVLSAPASSLADDDHYDFGGERRGRLGWTEESGYVVPQSRKDDDWRTRHREFEKNRREEWKERRKEEREAWKEWEKDRREAWKEREKARRESEKEWDKLHRDD